MINYKDISDDDKKEAIVVIKKAKDFFATHEWGRQKYYDSTRNTYCALGAIKAVLGVPFRTNSLSHNLDFMILGEMSPDLYHRQSIVFVSLDHVISKKFPDQFPQARVAPWNDAAVQGKDEVTDFYDFAVATLEKDLV